MTKESNFTEGRIAAPLIRFALPVLLAMCLQSLYGAVDLLIVGQFGGSADVSAVATGSQMMQVVTVLFTGLAMGTTILLGQMIGCGKRKEAGDVIGGSICLFAVLAVIVTTLMFLVAVPFTGIMNTPEEAVILGYFNGCGKTTFVMAQGLVGAFLIRIPVSWLMSRAEAPTLFGIGLAAPASTVIQILLCVLYFLLLQKKQGRESMKEGKGEGQDSEQIA